MVGRISSFFHPMILQSQIRWLQIFTPLNKEDWKLQGNIGTILPIKNVLENHKDEMRILVGDLYLNKGKLVAQLDKLGKK